MLLGQGLDVELDANKAGSVKVTLEGPIAVRKKVKNPPPIYPDEALADSSQGTVRIWLVVSKDGAVTSAKVDSSSGQKLLDNAALDAVKSWAFAKAEVVDTGYATFRYSIGSGLLDVGTGLPDVIDISAPALELGDKPQTLIAVAKVTTEIRKKSSVEIKSKTKLDYPDKAKEARESGTVTVRAYLKAKGDIIRVEVVSSSGSETLDKAAADCVKSWKFYTKSEATVEVDFIFELQ